MVEFVTFEQVQIRLVTAILMFVTVAVATDKRVKGLPAGLATGGAVALNVFWAGPIYGASKNAARSFAPLDALPSPMGLLNDRPLSGYILIGTTVSWRQQHGNLPHGFVGQSVQLFSSLASG
ncbi:MAG: hypothetical protein F4X14_13720 [Caldilineaceae bacterium SB0661_bin_32]|uniref:Uncharacterized protein n=1 Tax=Caldilineaceae bacterium SB0661_bin_32 TaxID=2605255 RepID=A0A6B1D8T9_9CHLR|nr:hypothetical protein [Caldilineaceae bacterium SB0661_bin_32]